MHIWVQWVQIWVQKILKIGVVIIKFSELTKKLFKIAKNNVTYGPDFAEGIIKAVAKNGSYAPYTFEGYYKGKRTIR